VNFEKAYDVRRNLECGPDLTFPSRDMWSVIENYQSGWYLLLVSGLFFLLRQVWCQVSLFICWEMHMYTKIMWNLSKNNKEPTQDFSCEFLLLAEIAQSTFDALDSQWVFGSIFHFSILFSSGSERVTRMICWKSIADCHYDV